MLIITIIIRLFSVFASAISNDDDGNGCYFALTQTVLRLNSRFKRKKGRRRRRNTFNS